MGYYASVDGSLQLVAGAASAAVSALGAITSGYSTPPGLDTDEAAVNELGELLKQWLPISNFEVTMPDDAALVAGSTSVVRHPTLSFWGYGKLREEDEAFAAIAPHVLGEASFDGEDSYRWRVRFNGGQEITDTACTVFDCDEKDHVSGIWIGQIAAAAPDAPDVLVTALDGSQVRRKLAGKCRTLLEQCGSEQARQSRELDDADVLVLWQTISGAPVTIICSDEQ